MALWLRCSRRAARETLVSDTIASKITSKFKSIFRKSITRKGQIDGMDASAIETMHFRSAPQAASFQIGVCNDRGDKMTVAHRAPGARALLAAIAGAVFIMGTQAADAEDYPNRQVRLVLPFSTGGSTDAIARLVGQKMSESLGQPVVVENRPGAAGAIASQQVAGAPPDGYTILMATTSTHAILPVVNPRLSYDAEKDFVPIGLVARAPNLLVTGPATGASSVKELVSMARSNPNSLSFASSGTGTITHLVGELFKSSAGIEAVHVPYKTGVQALPDLISGQIAFQFDSIVWTLPQVRAGKIKGLAVTGLTRSTLAPELPTVAESGLPGFEGVTWFAFVAPAATPPSVLSRLNSELNLALRATDVQEKLAAQGAEAAPGTPEDLARLIREDRNKWSKVIRDAGVKIE